VIDHIPAPSKNQKGETRAIAPTIAISRRKNFMSASNGVLFQYFHWHNKPDGTLWRELAENAKTLKDAGITAIWIPPAYKAAGGEYDTGYGVYDLFDLGEFDQKNTTRTKYGTKVELIDAVRAAQLQGLQVYADVVLNHRQGADETEDVDVVKIHKHDRNQPASASFKMKAWTKFTFPSRGETYSSFKWDASCFTATDCNADAPGEEYIYLMHGKTFSGEVSSEFGNFDYLMGCDVDVYNTAVREELFYWGRWFVDQTGVDGFRLDAVKHIPASFYRDFFNHIRTHFNGRELLGVGEYWTNDLAELQEYLGQVEGVMKLFDVPLHFKFMEASKAGQGFDLTKIFEGTLTQADGLASVTFVDNHDTQPGQSLESWVDDWFKPLAYALILLRDAGYPCVFYGDYYGASEEHCKLTSHRMLIDAMLDARRKYQFGDQHDYFDHPNCIAWARTGNEEHPGSLVVVMSNGEPGTKRVNTYAKDATFKDLTGHAQHEIKTDAEGFADFTCPGGSLSIWVQQ
jgi:alpha-amylase